MTTKDYKELIENNGYINREAVIEYLRNNCIADYEIIADVFNKGMSNLDYTNLQEALDEIENDESEE